MPEIRCKKIENCCASGGAPRSSEGGSAGSEIPHVALYGRDVRHVGERDSLSTAAVDEIDDRAVREIAVRDLHADAVAVPNARQLLLRSAEPVVPALEPMGAGEGRDACGRVHFRVHAHYHDREMRTGPKVRLDRPEQARLEWTEIEALRIQEGQRDHSTPKRGWRNHRPALIAQREGRGLHRWVEDDSAAESRRGGRGPGKEPRRRNADEEAGDGRQRHQPNGQVDPPLSPGQAEACHPWSRLKDKPGLPARWGPVLPGPVLRRGDYPNGPNPPRPRACAALLGCHRAG